MCSMGTSDPRNVSVVTLGANCGVQTKLEQKPMGPDGAIQITGVTTAHPTCGGLHQPVVVPPASVYAAEISLGGRSVTPEPCSCCHLCATHASAAAADAAAVGKAPSSSVKAPMVCPAAVVVPELPDGAVAEASEAVKDTSVVAPQPRKPNLDWECLLSAIDIELKAHNRALAMSLAAKDAEETVTSTNSAAKRGRNGNTRRNTHDDADWESGESSDEDDDEGPYQAHQHRSSGGSAQQVRKRARFAHSESESEEDVGYHRSSQAAGAPVPAPRAQAAGRRGPRGQSRFKGVCITRAGKWRAVIYIGRKQKYLGVFDSEASAAHAYDAAAVHHFGAGAKLNFPPSADGKVLEECDSSDDGEDWMHRPPPTTRSHNNNGNKSSGGHKKQQYKQQQQAKPAQQQQQQQRQRPMKQQQQQQQQVAPRAQNQSHRSLLIGPGASLAAQAAAPSLPPPPMQTMRATQLPLPLPPVQHLTHMARQQQMHMHHQQQQQQQQQYHHLAMHEMPIAKREVYPAMFHAPPPPSSHGWAALSPRVCLA